MRSVAMLLSVALLSGLAGCGGPAAENMAGRGVSDESGRYAGVGIYEADALWNEIGGADATSDARAARQADDGQVIVVIDRQTGEVRQCGNRSGFCVAMNPWKGTGRDRTPRLPAQLNKHAADLVNDSEAQNEAAPPVRVATPK